MLPHLYDPKNTFWQSTRRNFCPIPPWNFTPDLQQYSWPFTVRILIFYSQEKKKKKDRYILVRKQANRNMQVCIYGMLSEGRALNPENSLTISSWDRNS